MRFTSSNSNSIPISIPFLLLTLLTILPSATAQFHGIFEQMFGGGGGGGGAGHHQFHHQHSGHAGQRQGGSNNVGSDSSWWRANWDAAQCDKYLCPGTLSCVDRPSHCPCAWPAQEDKVELDSGLAVCASKGGWKAGEMARKIELARKGLL